MSLEQQIAALIASTNSLVGEVSGKMSSISSAVESMRADAHTLTLYLSPTGSDNNDGSLNSPLATVAKALTKQAAGRLNLVLTGTTLAMPYVFTQYGLDLGGRDVHIYFSDIVSSQYGRLSINGNTWWNGRGTLTLHSYFSGSGKIGTFEIAQNATILQSYGGASLSFGDDTYILILAIPAGVTLKGIRCDHSTAHPLFFSIAHVTCRASPDVANVTPSPGTFKLIANDGLFSAVFYSATYFTAPTNFDMTDGGTVAATPIVANKLYLLTV